MSPPTLDYSQLVRRGLLRTPKTLAVLGFCLGLGLLGRILVGVWLGGTARALAQRSRSLMTADLEISGLSPLSPERQESLQGLLPPGSVTTQTVRLTTLARPAGSSESPTRLVRVLARDPAWPLVGALGLEPFPTDAESSPPDPAPCWLPPDLLEAWDLGPGSFLTLGESRFRVAGVLRQEPGLGSSLFRFAPTVLIPRQALAATGLTQAGSRARYSTWIALAEPTQAASLQAELSQAWGLPPSSTDPEAGSFVPTQIPRIQTAANRSQRLVRGSDRFGDTLRLVSLCVLWMAGLGFRQVLASAQPRLRAEVALLGVLGATPRQALGWALAPGLFSLVLGILLAGILAGGLSWLLPLGLNPELQKVLAPAFSPLLGFEVGLLGLYFFWAFAWPSLKAAAQTSPQEVFRESPGAESARGSWGHPLASGLGFWLLASLETRSLYRGAIFVATFAAGALCLLGLARLGMVGARRAARRLGPTRPLSLVFGNLGRESLGPSRYFATLGLVAFLATFVTLARTSFLELSRPPEADEMAELFLVDLQPDQRDWLRQKVRELRIPDFQLSPMIQARLVSIDGVGITRDQAQDREGQSRGRFQRRMQNLSYRREPGPDETLVWGPWPRGKVGEVEGEPLWEISIEEGFARRIGAGLESQLGFEIQGVELFGVVNSIRRVRWTSFRPNHFLLFPPEALEEAPTQWVASVGPSPEPTKQAFLDALRQEAPNVVAIDVARQIERARTLLEELFLAASWIGAAGILAAGVVLWGSALSQIETRRNEASLLEVLGAPPRQIRRLLGLEMALLTLGAVTFGGLLAGAISWPLFEWGFRLPWVAPGLELLGVLGGLSLFGLLPWFWLRAKILSSPD